MPVIEADAPALMDQQLLLIPKPEVVIQCGGISMTGSEFCEFVMHGFLTPALIENDPRIELQERIKGLRIMETNGRGNDQKVFC